MGSRLQETKWDAEREKCINTYAHASASQFCFKTSAGSSKILRWMNSVQIWIPKRGPAKT
jgi:hypothetical protein